jgi:hypothetical protein
MATRNDLTAYTNRTGLIFGDKPGQREQTADRHLGGPKFSPFSRRPRPE